MILWVANAPCLLLAQKPSFLSSSDGSPSSLQISPTQSTVRSFVQYLRRLSAAVVCSSSLLQQKVAPPKDTHIYIYKCINHLNTYVNTCMHAHTYICTLGIKCYINYVCNMYVRLKYCKYI